MTTPEPNPSLAPAGTVPEIPTEPINGVQPWQRPSKPMLPMWPPWEERMRLPERLPVSTRHKPALGLSEFRLLADALWPNREPEVTFEQLLGRARSAAGRRTPIAERWQDGGGI